MSTEITNEKKLRKLLAIMEEDTLTRAEFVSAFEQVIKLVQKMKEKNEMLVDKMAQTYQLMMEKMKSDHSTGLSEVKKKAMEYCMAEIDKMMKSHSGMMEKMEKKMQSMKDGKDADETRIVDKVLSRMPEQKDVILDTPEQMRDKLEKLKGKERLNVSAIDGLEDKLEEVKTSVKQGQYVPGGAKGRVHYYDLTSQCNGVLKTFTIPFNFGVLGVFSTQAPINYRPVVDWTVGDKTLTLTSQVDAPATNQTLWIAYVR